jgi:hypothetical protein
MYAINIKIIPSIEPSLRSVAAHDLHDDAGYHEREHEQNYVESNRYYIHSREHRAFWFISLIEAK